MHYPKMLFGYVTLELILLCSAFGQEFIKAPNGSYWKIDSGLKRLFTSSESIEGYGLHIESAVAVDQQQFDSYLVGEPMPTRKIIRRTMKIAAQDSGEVRIPTEGWVIVD